MTTNELIVVVILILCQLDNSLGVLKRNILNEGSHRDVFTKIHVSTEDMAVSDYTNECKLLFIEIIPSGAYADPYQLAGLKLHNGLDFYLKDTIDLEQPEFMSKEFKLLIYSNLTKVDDSFISQYTLPIHLRYHAISSNEDFAIVIFPDPEVAIRCVDKETNTDNHIYKGKSDIKIKERCDSGGKQLCDWTQLQFEQRFEEIKVKMPVGKAEHFYFVTIGTVLTTVLGCVYLVFTSVKANVKLKAE